MSNWICDKCGATYIDVSHREPSVLKQELEIRRLKGLLVECRDIVKENLEFSKSIGRNRIQPRNKGLLKRIDETIVENR